MIFSTNPTNYTLYLKHFILKIDNLNSDLDWSRTCLGCILENYYFSAFWTKSNSTAVRSYDLILETSDSNNNNNGSQWDDLAQND